MRPHRMRAQFQRRPEPGGHPADHRRIESVEGATLLHVDPGKATNRTVVTFAGAPEAVVEAAFRAIQKAAGADRHAAAHRGAPAHGRHRRLSPGSDLRHHHGGDRRATPAGWPSGWAGSSAFRSTSTRRPSPTRARKNLAVIRAGEYEGLAREDWPTRLDAGLRTRRIQPEERRHRHRRPGLPGGLQRQPQHHLDPPRQRRRVRRPRGGPAQARGRSAHRQGGH